MHPVKKIRFRDSGLVIIVHLALLLELCYLEHFGDTRFVTILRSKDKEKKSNILIRVCMSWFSELIQGHFFWQMSAVFPLNIPYSVSTQTSYYCLFPDNGHLWNRVTELKFQNKKDVSSKKVSVFVCCFLSIKGDGCKKFNRACTSDRPAKIRKNLDTYSKTPSSQYEKWSKMYNINS